MVNVADKIKDWSRSLPYWERATLDKIAAGCALSGVDYQEILGFFLCENGLSDCVKPLPELKLDSRSSINVKAKIKLVSISELQGVNALVPNQKITFSQGLTAIYGENGSGKSGYARVLGCAGFTRGDIYILPDFNTAPENCIPASANIEINDGHCVRTVCFDEKSLLPELHAVHVFDSTSVTAHIAKPNGFSFIPTALVCLPKLAESTDKVRCLLNELIETRKQPRDFTRLFPGESDVVASVRNLCVNSNLKDLESLATISAKDAETKKELERQKAELVLRNTDKKIIEIQTIIRDLTTLSDKIAAIEEGLCDTVIAKIKEDIAEFLRLERIASSEGVDQFANKGLLKVGSEEWQAFALHAKALAEAESKDRESYPTVDDVCLLCHRPLNPDACNLLTKLWAYLRSEAREALITAENMLKKRDQWVNSLDLQFFGEQSVSRRLLESEEEALVLSIKNFVESATTRRDGILTALRTHTITNQIQLASSPLASLNTVIQQLESNLSKLNSENTGEELEKVDKQLLVLQHREILSKHIGEIKEYIDGLKWAKKAESHKGNTKHVTIKYKELFQELVTEQYISLFEKMLAKLKCPMAVQITTKPEKGNVFKRIGLKTNNSHAENVPSPDKILSEGEQRAVALADFLTEVTLNEHSCGIVVDDPVTSLDHRWKEVIAECLVTEAQVRQVIVFTHDLHFLWMLNENATTNSTDICIHWIKRGDNDNQPGYVYLDNCPVLEEKYRKTTIARSWLDRAKKADPEEQELLLKQGFSALRTTYEAFVIYDLFCGVVRRWEERIRIDNILNNVHIDSTVVNTVMQKYGDLSRYIEGHSHTDLAIKPSPKSLTDEIEAFEELKKRHKELVKAAISN